MCSIKITSKCYLCVTVYEVIPAYSRITARPGQSIFLKCVSNDASIKVQLTGRIVDSKANFPEGDFSWITYNYTQGSINDRDPTDITCKSISSKAELFNWNIVPISKIWNKFLLKAYIHFMF